MNSLGAPNINNFVFRNFNHCSHWTGAWYYNFRKSFCTAH